MTIDPYKPIPWEAFTLIPTPPRPTPIPLGWKVFLTLAVLACVCGALAAVVAV